MPTLIDRLRAGADNIHSIGPARAADLLREAADALAVLSEQAATTRVRSTPMSNKTAAYFAPLVSLPTLINTPDSYVTRDGKVVSVSAVSDRHDFGCVGTYSNGIRESWHRSGRILATSETANDIIGQVAT